jgi:hypothetical protein
VEEAGGHGGADLRLQPAPRGRVAHADEALELVRAGRELGREARVNPWHGALDPLGEDAVPLLRRHRAEAFHERIGQLDHGLLARQLKLRAPEQF